MAEPKRKGFWSLFRSKSSATKNGKLEKDPLRRASEGDVLGRSRRPDGPAEDAPTRRRRPRRTDPGAAKGKGREDVHTPSYDLGPLTEWPPSGMSSSEELNLGAAMQLISRGVPAFKGHKRPIPHANDHYYALFATVAGNRGDETDAANQHDTMTQFTTLRLAESGPATYPWETLEQPSYAFCFGKRPGTITLNHWVSMASVLPPAIALRDAGVAPRDIDLEGIFARLKELDGGLEDDDEDLMYRNLYKRLLRDPDKYRSPHKTLDRQITDLIMVLSRPDWIDFTVPKNQVVTRFIFDTSPANSHTYRKFFHQLLLSLELELRIHSRHHMLEAKEKLLTQIPPTIQWNLALARRWRDNIRVDEYGETAEQVHLRYRRQRRQVKMLKRFAQMMKWPNLTETLAALRRRDADSTLDLVSSHAMAFFSGLVLPGPTFPFLIMNALLDIDPDRATDDLTLLTHQHPSCGFQYRNSYTYWTAASIVGKVLAPTCRSLAGWVGPARPTADLARNQIARIRARRPPSNRVTAEDVRSMSERSDPLGPPTQVFPVKEYALVAPDRDDDAYLADLVRIELLSLRPCSDSNNNSSSSSNNNNRTASAPPLPASSNPTPTPSPAPGSAAAAAPPRYFDASIQFAIDGVSWPLRLTYDVSFVSAWPCSDGPHPLFFDYVYTPVKADQLVKVRDWNGAAAGAGGGTHGRHARSLSPPAGGGKGVSSPSTLSGGDEERVLVVEAFGVPDNEVLARAWCAHWGLSAVVADLGRTCMACAIREAYAATMTVVILVDDEHDRGDE
ncbi:uncharacterized protein THITE_2059279 [Thermothielavioides terrestris NRRL 8126]|uniref:VTC domain-containing protein n=1 Tax=Thermothielavioides terrestris (strain ATCC 38088 / NRRL 8126) TaxID=578455 RepID=G2RFQ9_THETT|nr:uncharacterized protein THITE_2059279 [Thermothielavioides terrestris NRRL 8126]AEO71663.1 hypothetical protein THITE_2059279 [Thermothielavioides terrestris NRRL 8126]